MMIVGMYAIKMHGSLADRLKTAHEFCEKVLMIAKFKSISGFAIKATGGIIAESAASNIIIGIVGDVISTARMPTSETAPKL